MTNILYYNRHYKIINPKHFMLGRVVRIKSEGNRRHAVFGERWYFCQDVETGRIENVYPSDVEPYEEMKVGR